MSHVAHVKESWHTDAVQESFIVLQCVAVKIFFVLQCVAVYIDDSSELSTAHR